MACVVQRCLDLVRIRQEEEALKYKVVALGNVYKRMNKQMKKE